MSRFFSILGGEANLPSTADERAERARIQAILAEIDRLEPWGPVTEDALAALRSRFQARLIVLDTAPAERARKAAALAAGDWGAVPQLYIPPGPLTARPTALTPPPSRVPAEPPPPTPDPLPAGPTLREFMAERSILIVSYVGAFLLIVATLLFELAAQTYEGPVRFAGVLALDLMFAAAAWSCWRSPRLRIVGTTYLAISALIAPLVFVAAYVFLLLDQNGISVSLAVTVGGLSCALLYGLLASRLHSIGYAVLSSLALAVGWSAALILVGLQPWRGAGLVPLAILFSVASRPRGTRPEPRDPQAALPSGAGVLASVAEPFAHITAAAALVWSMFGAAEALFTSPSGFAQRWALTATLSGVTLDLAIYALLLRRWLVSPVVALGVSLSVFAAMSAMDLQWSAASVALLALSFVYALLSVRLPATAPLYVRGSLRALAAVQALLCSVIPASPDALQLAIVAVSTALGLVLARSATSSASPVERRGAPWWLLYTAALASVGWYWLIKVAIPPPPRPTLLGLLTAFAPLPLVLAAIGAAVGRRLGRRWAAPLYVAAALDAIWIGAALATEIHNPIAGATYLTFGLATYAIASLDRFPGGAAVSAALLMAGTAALLFSYDAPPEVWPVALGLIPWIAYGAGATWRQRLAPSAAAASPLPPSNADTTPSAPTPPSYSWPRGWPVEHRWTALALSLLVALACFGDAAFYETHGLAALSSLAALWSFAALLLVDSLTHGSTSGRHTAAFVATLGGIWLSRYLAYENPQWYVTLPGLALLWIGHSQTRRAFQRPEASRPNALSSARLICGTGLTLLLGTTAIQMAAGRPTDSLYTAVLTVESVAAILAGVALRQRVYILSGAGGVALAALRALLLLLSQIPLFLVFGIAALILLALAAALAALRGNLSRPDRRPLSWSDWS